MLAEVKHHTFAIVGTAGSWIGAIASWQEQAEWIVKVGAGCTAIAVSILTAISIVRGWRKK